MILCISAFPVYAAEVTHTYSIWLGDREIGQHTFRIVDRDGGVQVLSSANMEVKFLFVTVFRYQHEAREVWQGDCLTELSAETRRNGKFLQVNGRAEGDEFFLEIARDDDRESMRHPLACLGSYAYWDLDRLARTHLLNPETGEISEAELTPRGVTRLPLGEGQGDSFTLTTRPAELTLWYSQAREWLALASTIEGRRLVYLREDASGR